jgi:hypothetical protein
MTAGKRRWRLALAEDPYLWSRFRVRTPPWKVL